MIKCLLVIDMSEAICAIATPYGKGAISIIRGTGTGTIELVNKIFKGKDLTKVESNTINYGHIVYNGEVIDEVLVSVFLPPKTYTKEEVVEINSHGGFFVTNKILEIMLKSGFRLAEPGEFTKRAFLNGRIDLMQAESVMDMIDSENNLMLDHANKGLRKELTKLIENLRETLLNLLAKIEVNIDYPEYDDAVVMTDEIILPELKNILVQIDELIDNSHIGKVISSGIPTAIVGRPNVGKSSLLNMLLDEDKAIVSKYAGTTRDIVEGKLSLGDITLDLIDTAGIHESDDFIEQIGINKAKEALQNAELVLLVLDNSEITDYDQELIKLTENKKRIIILNKSDLNSKPAIDLPHIMISALHKEGIKEIKNEIVKLSKVNLLINGNANYLTNARQIATLELAKDAIKDAIKSSMDHIPVDMTELDIKRAWELLGEIIGISSGDELINQLFSKFCLGK